MSAQDNGVCPHCGRADSVKERDWLTDEARANLGVDIDKVRRFNCDGCGSAWQGVRYAQNIQHNRAMNGTRG